jgi:hypothetical protein
MTRTNRPAGGVGRLETGSSGPTRTYGTSVVDFKTPPHRTGLDLSTPFPQPAHTGAIVLRSVGPRQRAAASPVIPRPELADPFNEPREIVE